MEIVLADVYGFCFGVKRALDGVYAQLEKTPVVTLGALTHNKTVLNELFAKGVRNIDSLCQYDKALGAVVVIRAHGVAPDIYSQLEAKGIPYLDLTCPSVTANQQLARKMYESGHEIIITGDPKHPEIIGLNGWAGGSALIVSNSEDINGKKITADGGKKYFLMSQTTFEMDSFDKIKDEIVKYIHNLEFSNTICKATYERQQAAARLAASVDKVLVLGDKSSSNSVKLYEICKAVQKKSYFIENIFHLDLKNISICDKIGITAGASVPPTAIEEAIRQMSEFEKTHEVPEAEGVNLDVGTLNENEITTENGESFEQMLDKSVTTLHTGQVVTGKVISIVGGEVMVDLQYKSDGIIQRGQFAEDSSVDPSTVVSPGDEITVFVLRVNDGDGNVLLSKKRVDAQRGYRDIDNAFTTGEPVLGKVSEMIKGGLIVNVAGVRVFVPSSQATARFTKDLSGLVGQELNINILELDKGKRPWRIIGGRKELALKEENEAKEKAFAGLEEGTLVSGPVSSVAKFGAFVDLGGVDGLIHVSELSWGRVRNVEDVLKVGDIVEAYIIKADKETGRVSLTLKSVENDPWASILERYPIGSIVTGKVVRIVPFGAFIEVEDGIDGLVHISQIAHRHLKKPEDALSIGQEVETKVIEIDQDKRKISLSIKAAIDMDYDYDDDDYDDDDYDDDYDDDDVVDAVDDTTPQEEAAE